MATPRELVEAVAEVLNVSVGTVIIHDRNLATAPIPLRSVAGRGRAAARVSAVDAANLLIAVIGSQSVKDSVFAATVYGNLKLEKPFLTKIARVKKLPNNHSFGEILATLIEAATANELDDYYLNISLDGPEPHAFIFFHSDDVRGITAAAYKLKKKLTSQQSGDLTRRTSISHRTINRVAELMRSSK